MRCSSENNFGFMAIGTFLGGLTTGCVFFSSLSCTYLLLLLSAAPIQGSPQRMFFLCIYEIYSSRFSQGSLYFPKSVISKAFLKAFTCLKLTRLFQQRLATNYWEFPGHMAFNHQAASEVWILIVDLPSDRHLVSPIDDR